MGTSVMPVRSSHEKTSLVNGRQGDGASFCLRGKRGKREDEGMGRVASAWRLLLVTVLFAAGVAGATGRGVSLPEMRGPGFLYTISRGRCTPEYWSSRREAWPKMVPLSSSVSKIFGWQTLERYQPELTLLEATNRNDDDNAFVHLLRESSAALLNSYSRKGFPYTSWKVKSLLLQGLVSEKAATEQASRLSSANQDCD